MCQTPLKSTSVPDKRKHKQKGSKHSFHTTLIIFCAFIFGNYFNCFSSSSVKIRQVREMIQLQTFYLNPAKLISVIALSCSTSGTCVCTCAHPAVYTELLLLLLQTLVHGHQGLQLLQHAVQPQQDIVRSTLPSTDHKSSSFRTVPPSGWNLVLMFVVVVVEWENLVVCFCLLSCGRLVCLHCNYDKGFRATL